MTTFFFFEPNLSPAFSLFLTRLLEACDFLRSGRGLLGELRYREFSCLYFSMLIIIAGVMQRYLHCDSASRASKNQQKAHKDTPPQSQNSSGNAEIDFYMHLSRNSQISLANCFEKSTEKYFPKFWKHVLSTNKNSKNCSVEAVAKKQVKLGKASEDACSKNCTR
jgi:hypothetical protein